MENKLKNFKFKNVNRVFYLDQLRALAIIGVIGIHVTPDFFNSTVGIIFYFLSKIAIPIFFMITGALLLNKEYRIWDFLKKRYPRIIIPFIFWGAVYIIFAILFKNFMAIHLSLKNSMLIIINTFLGVEGYVPHFWYVWSILGLYLLFPIINKWIKNASFSEIRYFLFIWFITSIFILFNLSYHLELKYFSGILGLVILGYYLANNNNKILGNTFLWPILFLISTLTRIICHNFSIDVDYSSNLGTLSIIQAISIFLMIKNLNFNRIFTKVCSFLRNGIIGKLTVSLSRYSYGIYLNHMLFIISYRIMNLDFANKSAIIWVPLLIIAVLVFSWVPLIVMNKIPVLKKVTGMH